MGSKERSRGNPCPRTLITQTDIASKPRKTLKSGLSNSTDQVMGSNHELKASRKRKIQTQHEAEKPQQLVQVACVIEKSA